MHKEAESLAKPNSAMGAFGCTSTSRPLLLDQTNREGLMHKSAFDDLHRLVLFLFVQLEAHRQTIRHPQANGKPTRDTSGDQPLADLEQLAASLPAPAAARVRKVSKNLEEFLARQAQEQAQSCTITRSGPLPGKCWPVSVANCG